MTAFKRGDTLMDTSGDIIEIVSVDSAVTYKWLTMYGQELRRERFFVKSPKFIEDTFKPLPKEVMDIIRANYE